MELQDYWRTVRRRWRLVLGSVLVVLAVAAAWTWSVTPTYASTTRIFVSTSQTDENSAYTGNLFATQRVASYADLVTSNQLAERVADELGDTDAMDLREQVTASAVPETVLLEIEATDADPERARDIAQAYAEQLQLVVEELETPRGETAAVVKATLIDDAQVARSPVSPQPLRNLALAGILGLLLGVGLAVARELLDTSVKGADDIAEITSAPVLGNIFQDTDAKRAPSEVLSTATPWAEAFRVLRTNMQYVDIDNDQKVIVVTSALPGEGKSTTAVNLAVTLTQAGQRVALVECDLRRPLIADRLELDGAIGTTSVLIGKVSAEDVMQQYADTSLDVMVCGQIPPNPSELLQSQAMEMLLLDLRSATTSSSSTRRRCCRSPTPRCSPPAPTVRSSWSATGVRPATSCRRPSSASTPSTPPRWASWSTGRRPRSLQRAATATATATPRSRTSPLRPGAASAAGAEPPAAEPGRLRPGRAARGTAPASSAYAARSVPARPRARRAGRWTRPARRG